MLTLIKIRVGTGAEIATGRAYLTSEIIDRIGGNSSRSAARLMVFADKNYRTGA